MERPREYQTFDDIIRNDLEAMVSNFDENADVVEPGSPLAWAGITVILSDILEQLGRIATALEDR